MMSNECIYKRAKKVLKAIRAIMDVKVNSNKAAAAIRRVIKIENAGGREPVLTMGAAGEEDFVNLFRPVLRYGLNDSTVQELLYLKRYLAGDFIK